MFFLLSTAFAVAQIAHAHPPPPSSSLALELAHRPVPIRAGIGAAHDPVTTSSKDAQAFYDQGLAYLHSYVWLEAARSFNQALTDDPRLAMAYVGLSVAYTELNAASAAREALARARDLAHDASGRERQLIDARALQMEAEAAPADASRLAAYRAALDRALSAYPASEELWLARGKAESSDPAERGQGSGDASVPFYRKALTLAPDHFAAHHYLAHAFENATRPTAALTEAETYARMAPRIAHARHMLGHELRRLGRAEEAIAAFEAADAIESEYFAKEGIPIEYDWHYQHNLDLLGTSYQYIGRMAKAEPLLKRSFAISSNLVVQEFNKREWPVFLRANGRADEALEAARTLASHPSPLVSATGHIEAGFAHLARKEYERAAEEANTALRLMRGAPEGAGLLADALRQLQGEFQLRAGDKDKGRAALEEVAANVRARPGPDAWIQTTFTLESIARSARDADDWAFAAWAARQMIAHDPNYAGAHYALALAAAHGGDRTAAREELARARELWKNGDPDVLARMALDPK
jgi:tetratricopeptide (TPR) repeat protein